MHRSVTYGILGDGRVARHVSAYFDLLGILHVNWARRSAQAMGVSPEEALQEAQVILVLLKDDAIESFIREHPLLQNRPLVHFSGSLVTPLAIGAHPLMTFGPETYDSSTYEAIPFVLDEGEFTFSELFPDLDNPHYTLPKELRPLYHALCVMSGNFTTILWQKLFRDFPERLGLPPDLALPYLRQVTANLQSLPAQALTGPLARRDSATIASNLEALSGDEFEGVYRAFVAAIAPEVLNS